MKWRRFNVAEYRNQELLQEQSSRANGHDSELAAEVRSRLGQHGYVEHHTRVEPDVHGGKVILWGVADDRFARERAEQLSREVEGVVEVENRIAVQRESGGSSGPTLTIREPGAVTGGESKRPRDFAAASMPESVRMGRPTPNRSVAGYAVSR
jgi:osmotically-inducible protein OsmY